jgi:hypothetical protein
VTLGEAQRLFARRVPRLIDYINDAGYECTLGDAYRSPRAFGGMGENGPYGQAWSAHKQRLAIDLNLFLDGEYLSSTEAHRPFGEYWKSIDPENHVWGGDFDDGNHYSFRYSGIA